MFDWLVLLWKTSDWLSSIWGLLQRFWPGRGLVVFSAQLSYWLSSFCRNVWLAVDDATESVIAVLIVFWLNAACKSVWSGVVKFFSGYFISTREVVFCQGSLVYGTATEMVSGVPRATLGRAVCLAWINFIILIAGHESQTTTSTTHAEALATHREPMATRRDAQRTQMTAIPGKSISITNANQP